MEILSGAQKYHFQNCGEERLFTEQSAVFNRMAMLLTEWIVP